MKTCKTCGFTWKDGEHGSHDCWEVKDARHTSLREAAQAVSDGHWHERSYREMRSLIRAMDKVLLLEKER